MNTLEKIRSRFLWGGNEEKRKLHWVSWDKVLASKEDGGLGVGSIRSLNIGLMVKWWWRLKTEGDSLWGRSISGIHNITNKPHVYLSNRNISGVWNNINGVKDLIKSNVDPGDIFELKVNAGDKTQFWEDRWIGPTSLKSRYPSLYALESRKRCRVADRFFAGTFAGHWTSCPISLDLGGALNNLQAELSQVRLNNAIDGWRCVLAADGRYTVGDLRKKIDHLNSASLNLPKITWSKAVPIKVSCFIWRAIQKRIASLKALSFRRIEIPSTHCGACINTEEDADHALVLCPFAKEVCQHIFKWCGIQNEDFNNIEELIDFATKWGRGPKKKVRFMAICYGLLWNIWRYRNERAFGNVFINPHKGAENIKSMVYLWVKSRINDNIGDWDDWCQSPFM